MVKLDLKPTTANLHKLVMRFILYLDDMLILTIA